MRELRRLKRTPGSLPVGQEDHPARSVRRKQGQPQAHGRAQIRLAGVGRRADERQLAPCRHRLLHQGVAAEDHQRSLIVRAHRLHRPANVVERLGPGFGRHGIGVVEQEHHRQVF
jgi:hypothetical protein